MPGRKDAKDSTKAHKDSYPSWLRETPGLDATAVSGKARQLEKRVQRYLSAGDVCGLRSMAHEGFVSDRLRRRVWPCLLGLDSSSSSEPLAADVSASGETLDHAYAQQVAKDVPRGMHQFDVVQRLPKAALSDAHEALTRVVNRVFARNRNLHYIQGFHDVCSVPLLVGGELFASKLCAHIATHHHRDSLRKGLGVVSSILLSAVYPLVAKMDPTTAKFLERSGCPPVFALSWVLTWFSHNLSSIDDAIRVFDFMLASHPLMPVYLSAACIVQLRTGLLKRPCEIPAVHGYFQKLPPSLNAIKMIHDARNLAKKTPPHALLAMTNLHSSLPPDSPLWVSRAH